MTVLRPLARIAFCLAALGLAALALRGLLPGSLAAQETQRVAAVVNDDIVSLHDLEQRMRLVLLSSNLPDTVETRSRVLPQVLRRLIDERLQIQEADRLKIAITASDIADGVNTIERNNNMQRGAFESMLRTKGIDPETARQQVRAELAWVRAVRHELMADLHVSEEGVEERLGALRANYGKPEYSVAEILLAIDDPRREEETRILAERLIDQLRQGAPFSALALQFSQTGAGGGNLGWVSEGMLDDQLVRALSRMEPGTVSPPIRTIDGYHILLLMDKRLVGQGFSLGTTYDLLTIDLTSLPSATVAERDAQLQRLQAALATGKSCDDFERLTKEVPSANYNRVSSIPASQLPEQIRGMITALSPGHVSEPVQTPNSRRLFALCAINTDEGGLPTREAIRRRMEDEQLEVMARRYLRDIRRAAFIEIRM